MYLTLSSPVCSLRGRRVPPVMDVLPRTRVRTQETPTSTLPVSSSNERNNEPTEIEIKDRVSDILRIYLQSSGLELTKRFT